MQSPILDMPVGFRRAIESADLSPLRPEIAADRPDDWREELDRCRRDPLHWIDHYAWIEERHDPSETVSEQTADGAVRFRLWPAQREGARVLLDSPLAITLKARQLGWTWLVDALGVHRCLFRASQLVQGYSITQEEANDLVHRARFIYQHLPEWMRAALPAIESDAIRRLRWANGSEFRARAATRRAGRATAVSVMIMDEAAHMAYARQLYDAGLAAVEAGGQLWVLSTANGAGGLFYDLWQSAYAGLSDFKPLFIPWMARPGRDAEWYARKLRNSTDPEIVAQEYPSNPQEAFVSSGRARFLPEWLKPFAAEVARPGLPVASWPESLRNLDLKGKRNRLVLHAAPMPRRRVAIGADVSEGIGRAWDAATAWDLSTGEQLATLQGQWEHDEYARLLIELTLAYNAASLVIERNNDGKAVLVSIKNSRHPKAEMVWSRTVRGTDGRPGWPTTGGMSSTKEAGIGQVAAWLRDGKLTVRDRATLAELADFRVNDDGSCSASPGKHDDLAMSLIVLASWAKLRDRIPRAAAGGGYAEMPG